MKKHYLTPKLILVLLLTGAGLINLKAQTLEYLNLNNMNAGICIGGNLFTNEDSLNVPHLFETPKGGNVDAIFTQSLWLTALDANDTLYCAANRYWDYGIDFWDGPIASTYDTIYDRYYKRVWKVTQQQITQFKTLNFPTTEALVDSSILFWPGKGNPSVLNDYGITIGSVLAPFVDLNGNGIYEPLLGDYPGICGDEGIFFVYNDARTAHTQSNGKALGVEVRGLATEFTDTTTTGMEFVKRAINNTVFVQYQIENKSTTNYTSFDVANWVDPDIGCFSNDYAGCDTARSLMFAYNGTETDPDCAPENGYGTLPIALGVKMLNQPMDVFGVFDGQGASSAAVSDPITAQQYRNYSEGFWANDTPFTEGGYGYDTLVGAVPTKFLFTGDPNISGQWSEPQSHDVPGDRRMFGSTFHQPFNAGDIKHFDYAFFTSYDSTSDHFSIIDSLKRDADIINSFYYNTLLPCASQTTTGLQPVPVPDPFTVSIYPNPAHNNVTIIATGDNIQSIELMDIQGRIILRKTVEARYLTLPVNYLAKGVYLINVLSGNTSVVKKVVVE